MQSGVKIAIGGKGGVGKTTVCAVLAQLFAEDGLDVLTIDADPNANLASAFGVGAGESPEQLIKMKQLIAERTGTDKESIGSYFKLNPKVSDLPEEYWLEVGGRDGGFEKPLKLLVLGCITHGGGGCACPEGAFLKAMLTHTILQRQEMVIVDLAAGVEFMGRASVQGIDALIAVVEPGSRSIETAINMAKMGKELGVKQVAVIANKITEAGQIEMIKSQLGDMPVLANVKYSEALQEADMKRIAVINASEEVVGQLRKAKEQLTALIKDRSQKTEAR